MIIQGPYPLKIGSIIDEDLRIPNGSWVKARLFIMREASAKEYIDDCIKNNYHYCENGHGPYYYEAHTD